MFETSSAVVLALNDLPLPRPFTPGVHRPATDTIGLVEDPFDIGFLAGRKAAEAALQSDRDRLAMLISATQMPLPDIPRAIASELLEVVMTLVVRVIGEAPVAPAWLLGKIEAAAEIVAHRQEPRSLRLHPADIALIEDAELEIAIVADRDLPRGSIVLESGSMRVEDGRDVALRRLRETIEADMP